MVAENDERYVITYGGFHFRAGCRLCPRGKGGKFHIFATGQSLSKEAMSHFVNEVARHDREKHGGVK